MSRLVAFVCILASVSSFRTNKRRDALLALDNSTLTAFLVPFRESILQRVAVAWNHTLGDSARLQVELQTCSNQIKANVENCKTCAANACKQQSQTVYHSPTFTDYLNVVLELVNPVNFLKEPLNEIGNSFGDLVDLLGDGSQSFIDSITALGKGVGGTFTDAFHGIESAYNTVKDSLVSAGNSVVSAGNTVVDGITDVGNTIGDGLSSVGHAVEHLGGSILHGLGSNVYNFASNSCKGIFGRKRTTISPELQVCMAPCAPCKPLLMPTQREMITSVCGANVVAFNDTVRANVIMIKGIFAAVSDKAHPVITKIEVDPASQSGVTYGTVYVTAMVKGRYIRYQSTVPYDMMNLGSSARNIAREFWEKWV